MTMMTRMKSLLFVGLYLGASIQSARSEEPVKVGFAIAQSGWMQAYDMPAYRGALMRIKEINAAGGLLGRQVEALTRDTKTDRAEGVRAGQEMVDAEVDMLVVSGDYNFGAPIALAAERAGMISWFAAAEDVKAGLQGVGPHSFNASAANAVALAATVGEWSYDKLKVRKPFLLLDTSIDYNKSTCAGFKWIFSHLDGVTIAGEDTFKNDDPSIASQISAIKALPEQPDAIALCSYTPGSATAIRQLRAAGIDAPILNGDAMDGTYWLDSVPNISKVYIGVQASVRGDDPRPAVNAFSQAYAKEYGTPPDQQSAISGYIMMGLWADAVTRAGTLDAGKVKDVLETFNEVATIASPRTFTKQLHISNKPDLLIEEAVGYKLNIIGNWKLSREPSIDVLMRK